MKTFQPVAAISHHRKPRTKRRLSRRQAVAACWSLGLSLQIGPAAAQPAAPAPAKDQARAAAGNAATDATTAGAQAALPVMRVNITGASATRSEGSGAYNAGASSSATGLGLSLRDTPQSVSVVTRQRIDDQAMASVADALVNTPGVSLKAVDRGRNNLSVRGFDVSRFQFDGIPFTTGNIGIESLSTVVYDRVEVLRGANGLLSGAGEPSATVNLVRKHADSKRLSGTASVELGSWQRRASTLDLSLPLNTDASVRARVVAHAYQQNAFVDLEHSKGTVLYGVVDADLSPTTRLSLGASDQRDQRSGVLWFPLPLWYSDGSRTDWSRSKTSATRWNQWDTTDQTLFATLEHKLPSRWTLRADLSHHRQDEDSKLLWLSGTPDRSTGLGLTATPYHYLSQPRETQLSLTATGPFVWLGRQHELTAGLLHSQLKDGWSNRDAIGSLAEVGDFKQWDGSYAEPALGARYAMSGGTTTQSAAYAAARLQFSDALKLIVGARLSQWRRHENGAADSLTADRVLTPYAGLVYDLGEQVSAYASYSDIFNPQTNRQRDGSFLAPLKGKSHEAGLKGEFLGGKLNASAAIFRVVQDNFAVADGNNTVLGTVEQAYVGVQGTVAKGYELELVGQPSRQWNLSLGWTHYSAKDANGADVASHHPRQMLKFATSYALQGLWQGLSLGGSLRWEDQPPKRQSNPVGVEEATGQPAYSLLDLMAKYQFSPQWSLQLNINNALDKSYRNGSPWWDGFTYGEPRNTKLTASYRF